MDADWDADALITALVGQTLTVGRAQRPAHGVLADEAAGAALGVDAGSRLANAGHVGRRVSQESNWARALSAMVGHGALGVRSAHGGGAGGARVLAAAVDAGLVGRAVLVGPAADAAQTIEADVTQETVVFHSASQNATTVDTLFVEGALAVGRTERNAATKLAATLATADALVVLLTGHRQTDAFLDRLARESVGAGAHRLVVFDAALGVDAAAGVGSARVDALALDAGLGARTFGAGGARRPADAVVAVHVGRTLGLCFAEDGLRSATESDVSGVAFEALTADAEALVVARLTLGIRSALDAGAGVDALGFAGQVTTAHG